MLGVMNNWCVLVVVSIVGIGACPLITYNQRIGYAIPGHNLERHEGVSVDQCAELCDANDECTAFEYATHRPTGKAAVYPPLTCYLQNGGNDKAKSHQESPGYENLDVYFKPDAADCAYKHLVGYAVPGHNLKRVKGVTAAECAKLCDEEPKCPAFEYGTDRETARGPVYPHQTCYLQNGVAGARSHAKSAGYENLDLYVKATDTCEYQRLERYAIPGHNIMTVPGLTASQCAALCDVNPNCEAAEFGTGRATEADPVYPEGHCTLQDTSEGIAYHGGSIGYENIDLYIKPTETECAYKRIPSFAVPGHNMEKTTDVTAAKCAQLCDDEPKCLSFEYGTGRETASNPVYPAMTCTLQSAGEDNKKFHGLSHGYENIDLYVKQEKEEEGA